MNKPFYVLTVDGEDYRLCFSCASVVQLEEKLGVGLLTAVGDQNEISKVSTQVALLHAALQKYHHGIKMADAYNLYDKILENSDGNGVTDIVNAIAEAMKASGFIPPSDKTEETKEEAEKEPLNG